MKGNTKCRNWDGLGGQGNDTCNVSIQYGAYNFQFDFNRNYACLLPFFSYSKLFVNVMQKVANVHVVSVVEVLVIIQYRVLVVKSGYTRNVAFKG